VEINQSYGFQPNVNVQIGKNYGVMIMGRWLLNNSRIRFAMAMFVMVMSIGVGLLLCRQGPGLESDSLNYFLYPTSGNINDLPVHHGVLYPLVLRLITMAGFGIQTAVVVLNVVCYGAISLIIFGFVSSPFHAVRLGVSFLVSLVIIFSIPLLFVHASAMSEPLFLVFISAGFVSLCGALRGPTIRFGWLTLATVFLAFSCLTRYAGVSFLGAACASLLVFAPVHLIGRVAISGLTGLFGIIPLVAVLAWNWLKSGTATNRQLVWHTVPLTSLQEGAITISSWLLPDRMLIYWPWLGYVIGLFVIMLTLYLVIMSVWKKRTEVGLFGLAAVAYIAFLLLSITALDVSIMLNHRMLSPLAVVFMLMVWLHYSGQLIARGKIRFVVWAVVAYMVTFTGVRCLQFVKTLYFGGSGFNSMAWHHSLLVSLVDAMDGEVLVYSNASDALYLRGSVHVQGIPWRLHSTSLKERLSFSNELNTVMVRFDTQPAALVNINLRYWPPYLASEQSLVDGAQLVPVVKSSDGVIYTKKDSPSAAWIINKAKRLNDERGQAELIVFE
jgi:hypothetical protein